MAYINPETAQSIVQEISEITGQNTNLMNGDGLIIASTDKSRIGSTHFGAKKIIDENLSELYISPDLEDGSTKTGLNLPIKIEHLTVGVIGITGKYEEVIPHARLAQRITEILVNDSLQKEQHQENILHLRDFLRDWVMGEGLAEGERFVNRGLTFNIDIKIPRRVMVIEIRHSHQDPSNEWFDYQTKFKNDITRMLNMFEGCYYLFSDATIILILPRNTTAQLKKIAIKFSKKMESELDLLCTIGIDSIEEGTTAVSVSYLQARKALQAATLSHRKILCYDDITLESLFDMIAESDKRAYIKKLFPMNDPKLFTKLMVIIEAWFEHDGSVTKAADALYMHKNTFQYQLKKILEISGHDIRKPYGAALFYVALLFHRELEKHSEYPSQI